MALLNTTTRDPDGKIVLPVPITLGFSGLEVLVASMEGIIPPVSFPLNLKLWMIPDCFQLLTLVDHQAKKGFIILVGVIDHDYHEEIEGIKNCLGLSGLTLGAFMPGDDHELGNCNNEGFTRVQEVRGSDSSTIKCWLRLRVLPFIWNKR